MTFLKKIKAILTRDYYVPYQDVKQMDINTLIKISTPNAEVNSPEYPHGNLPNQGSFVEKHNR